MFLISTLPRIDTEKRNKNEYHNFIETNCANNSDEISNVNKHFFIRVLNIATLFRFHLKWKLEMLLKNIHLFFTLEFETSNIDFLFFSFLTIS